MGMGHPAATGRDGDLVRARAKVGDFDLTVCSDGTYMLDGGAMFGVVPKTLWQKRMVADEQNRVLLGLNTVVVRTGGAVVVIETGIGNKQSPKMREIHGNQERLMASLDAANVDLEEVTHVVNTHLHFDHCGWNTTLHEDGTVTPTFCNARYYASEGEVRHGRLQLERDRVSYLAANYEPLIATGQMELVDVVDGEGFEVVPGVWLERLPGHTATMMGVHVESGGDRACYVSDLIPTSCHVDPTWVMGYDLDPLRCIEERKRFLKRAVEGQWIVMFPHDHRVPLARLEWNEKGKPVAKNVGFDAD